LEGDKDGESDRSEGGGQTDPCHGDEIAVKDQLQRLAVNAIVLCPSISLYDVLDSAEDNRQVSELSSDIRWERWGVLADVQLRRRQLLR
jgi:hypothetical protein